MKLLGKIRNFSYMNLSAAVYRRYPVYREASVDDLLDLP